MKFTGIIASLAVAGLASAAAIPRDTTVTTSAVDSTLAQLNTVISSVQSTVGGIVGNVNGVVNLDGLSSQLSEIKTLLGAIQAVPSSKRDIVTTATGLAGGAVTEAETVANPALSPVESIAGPTVNEVTGTLPGGLKRDVTNLVSALPVAQSVVADIQSNAAVETVVKDLESLVSGLGGILSLPLALTGLGGLTSSLPVVGGL